MNSKESIKNELKSKLNVGRYILRVETAIHKKLSDDEIERFKKDDDFQMFLKNYSSIQDQYNSWYTSLLPSIRVIAPERYDEFVSYYNKLDKRKASDITHLNYTISDYLIGLTVTRGYQNEEVVNGFSVFTSKFQIQLSILSSCIEHIDSSLNNIEGVLLSALFDSELEAARDLLKKNHSRASGAVVGVTLESHLRKVCKTHSLKLTKKNPTIADFNDKIRESGVIDTITWRLIQRLGDIRNLCVHSKDREPTKDEVNDLIIGTEKLIAELY